MTTINLDEFEERLMQRANAEQNIANRLYNGQASNESYMQASVTAGVLRELAATVSQMKETHTVTINAPENRNVDATDGPPGRQFSETEGWELEDLVEAKDQRISQLESKVEELEGALESEEHYSSKMIDERDRARRNYERVENTLSHVARYVLSQSEDLFDELANVSNSLDFDAVKCRNLVSQIRRAFRPFIEEADMERALSGDAPVLMFDNEFFQQSAVDFMYRYEAMMPPRLFKVEDQMGDWTVEDLYLNAATLESIGPNTLVKVQEIVETIYNK